MSEEKCYQWDDQTQAALTIVSVTNAAKFTVLLAAHLSEGYLFITDAEIAARLKAGAANIIDDGLLGSISEYAVYLLRIIEEGVAPPFIHCFRAPDPLGKANFPLVDIAIFYIAEEAPKDIFCLQEVKATREDPDYFGKCRSDFEGLYAQSRLAAIAEHVKYDLKMAGRASLQPRINDCLGTCPTDSTRIRVIPTGVSGDTVENEICVKKLQSIISDLHNKGWPMVEGMYLRVPAIEETYKLFALGKGAYK